MLFSVYLGVLGGKNPCRIFALSHSNYFVAFTSCVSVVKYILMQLPCAFLALYWYKSYCSLY